MSENWGRLLPGRVNRENDDSPVGQLPISQSLAFPMLDAFLQFWPSIFSLSLKAITQHLWIAAPMVVIYHLIYHIIFIIYIYIYINGEAEANSFKLPEFPFRPANQDFELPNCAHKDASETDPSPSSGSSSCSPKRPQLGCVYPIFRHAQEVVCM